jgi:hypothetical protein
MKMVKKYQTCSPNFSKFVIIFGYADSKNLHFASASINLAYWLGKKNKKKCNF